MFDYKDTLKNLQDDCIKVLQCLSKLIMSNSESPTVIGHGIDEYMTRLEELCIRSRNSLEKYRKCSVAFPSSPGKCHSDSIRGSIEVLGEGWLHITLNALLPNSRRESGGYIGDTVSRLIQGYGGELPYFDNAFMAIVEHCNYENHNALDNDNKAWKAIPNALKGRVIEDDTQFRLSVGLFSKLSDDMRCDIYSYADGLLLPGRGKNECKEELIQEETPKCTVERSASPCRNRCVPRKYLHPCRNRLWICKQSDAAVGRQYESACRNKISGSA